MIDFSSEFGQRAAKRLVEDQIIWLTTVDHSGAPQPRPVWFLWDGTTILIFSRGDGFKLRHVENNPKVSLNLDSDGQGGDIVVLLGKAKIDQAPITQDQLDHYIKKYNQGLERLNMTQEEFKETYSSALRITLTAMRGH